jgi:hypothetical protein
MFELIRTIHIKLRRFFTPTRPNWLKEISFIKKYLYKKSVYSFTNTKCLPNITHIRHELQRLHDKKVDYIHDTLFGLIPWDYQFTSIQLIKRGGGDCNSIHRLIQVILSLQGKEAFLVHMAYKGKLLKGHTTCIYKENNLYWVLDYDTTDIYGFSITECVKTLIESKYNSKGCKHFYVEDLFWNKVKFKKIK